MDIKVIPPKVQKSLGARVASGEEYEFTRDIAARDGKIHLKGSRLYIHDATTDIHYGEISDSGSNWWCRTDHGISVWTTVEQCVAMGKLRKVEQP